MKTSIIRQRVADFLQRHVPFDTLSQQDLLELAGSGKVKFHESEEYVYRRGDAKGQFIWVIQQGRVEVLQEDASGEHLGDVLGEGDLLGLDRFTGDGVCRHSARTANDVILYGIAAELFESMAARHPAVGRYVSAHSSVSGNLGFNRTSWLEAEAPPLEFLRSRLVRIPPGASVEQTAALTTGSRSGVAALVDEGGRVVGTMTAVELCTGSARPCPPTLAAPLSTRTAARALLQSGRVELAITEDGTPDGRLVAMLTASELALFCGHDPAGLVSALRSARSEPEMAALLKRSVAMVRDGLAQPHDVDDCCRMGTQVMAALAEACIRLADEDIQASGIAPASLPHCWVMFGASARGDLTGPELPVIAVIYDDSDDAFAFTDSMYFTALAGEAAGRLHGFGLPGTGLDWPEGARPSMPLSEWKRLYSETIQNPLDHNLYVRRLFFDMRPLSGEVTILRQLEDHIVNELAGQEMAIPLLANDTLAHLPPLTFFRDMMLAMDGEQRDSFDIVEAVIGPLANAARVFAMARRAPFCAPVNTLARLEAALLDYPDAAEILDAAMDAFRIGLYYQTLAGDARIEHSQLGKFDQLLLKTAFSSIQRFLEFTISTFVPD